MIHQRTHPNLDVPDCFGCKVATIRIAPSVAASTPGGAAAAAAKAREARWGRDMPAYKRMRDAGLQPKGIDGAARIEAEATSRFEVESGQTYTGADQQRMQSAIRTFEDTAAHSVFEPQTVGRAV